MHLYFTQPNGVGIFPKKFVSNLFACKIQQPHDYKVAALRKHYLIRQLTTNKIDGI